MKLLAEQLKRNGPRLKDGQLMMILYVFIYGIFGGHFCCFLGFRNSGTEYFARWPPSATPIWSAQTLEIPAQSFGCILAMTNWNKEVFPKIDAEFLIKDHLKSFKHHLQISSKVMARYANFTHGK